MWYRVAADGNRSRRATPEAIREWWQQRRARYNAALFITAGLSFAVFILVAAADEDRLPAGFDLSAGNMVLTMLAFLVGVALANILYCLWPLAEILLKPRDKEVFRRWAYGPTLWLSVAATATPTLALIFLRLFG